MKEIIKDVIGHYEYLLQLAIDDDQDRFPDTPRNHFPKEMEVLKKLKQLLNEPDNLTIAYMAGVERGKDVVRVEIEKCEPVAHAELGVLNWYADMQFQEEASLYTNPQLTQRLSSDEIKEIVNDYAPADNPLIVAALAHHIQDALLEKNK